MGLAEALRAGAEGYVRFNRGLRDFLKDEAFLGALSDKERPEDFDPEAEMATRALDMVPGMAGVMIGKKALKNLGVDPAKDLIGQYTALWDKGIRAEIPDFGLKKYQGRELSRGLHQMPSTPEARYNLMEEMWRKGEPEDAIESRTGFAFDEEGPFDFADHTGGKVLEHPELARAYEGLGKDDMARLTVETERKKRLGGSYSPELDAIKLGYRSGKETAGHELQHGVQKREGFSRGGSPEEFFEVTDPVEYERLTKEIQVIDDIMEDIYQDIGIEGAVKDPEFLKLNAEIDNLKEARKNLSLTPEERHQKYLSLAGEWEARNVGKRAELPEGSTELGQALRHGDTTFLSGNPFGQEVFRGEIMQEGTADYIPLEDLIYKAPFTE